MVYDYIFLSSLAKSSELVLVQDQLMFQLSFIKHKPKKKLYNTYTRLVFSRS
jgi:hypothetical protein